MSNTAIKTALETRLMAMVDGIAKAQTQFDGMLLKPEAGEPFQVVSLMPAAPFNYGGTSSHRRYSGIFQVSLHFPFGQGSGKALAHAEKVAGWFPQGLSLTANNVTTRIDRTPEVKPGRVEGDRWVIPVRVTYFSNV